MTEEIVVQAVALRSQRRMALGDAIIGATALVHDIPLWTRNIKDFDWMDDVMLVNPFTDSEIHSL